MYPIRPPNGFIILYFVRTNNVSFFDAIYFIYTDFNNSARKELIQQWLL